MEEKDSNEKPEHVTEEQKDARLLDRAFAVIREHIDRGHAFTYSQIGRVSPSFFLTLQTK